MFKEMLNTPVFTSRFVIEKGSPILIVFHYDDGAWQFSGLEQDLTDDDFRIVSLGEIIEHDESVNRVANMPPGSQAIRLNPESPWRIIVKK